MRITEPTLTITSEEGSAYCSVEVDYILRFDPAELGDGARVVVTLRAAGADEPTEHGTVRPLELVLCDEPLVDDGTGVVKGRTSRRVHRHLLDVDEDWWTSGEDGEPIPIAEFRDRLIAQVDVRRSVVIAATRTNVFVGSFGPLASR